MQAFKAALRLIRTKKSIAIFAFLPIIMTMIYMSLTPTSSAYFTAKTVNFAVKNEDSANPLSSALIEVLDKGNAQQAYPEDIHDLRNKLFYMQIEYLLTIPKGFFEDYASYVSAGPESGLSAPKLLRTESAAQVAQQMNQTIERFLKVATLKILAEPEANPQVMADQLIQELNTSTSVNILDSEQGWGKDMDFMFRFSAYGILGSAIFIVGFIYTAFRDRKVLPRQLASPIRYSALSFGISMAQLLCILGIALLYVVTAFAYFGKQILNPAGLLALLNLFVFAFVVFALSVLLASSMRSESSIQVLGNVIPLALSFFGGVFIPVSLLSGVVRQISNFLPTYWYTKTLDDLNKTTNFDWAGIKPLLNNMLILVAFGLTFALVTLGINHYVNRGSGENLAVNRKF